MRESNVGVDLDAKQGYEDARQIISRRKSVR